MNTLVICRYNLSYGHTGLIDGTRPWSKFNNPSGGSGQGGVRGGVGRWGHDDQESGIVRNKIFYLSLFFLALTDLYEIEYRLYMKTICIVEL